MGSSVHIITSCIEMLIMKPLHGHFAWKGGADAIKKRNSSMKGNFIELLPRGNVMIGQTSQNKFNCRTDIVEIH